jgi:DNA replication protein DnaC
VSEQDELLRQVEELRQKYAGTARQVAEMRISAEEAREQVDAMREKYGLSSATLAEKLERRGIPKRHRQQILASGRPQETPALLAAHDLLDGKGVLLVLAGNAGRGKSFAAAWALAKRPGLWVFAPDLARVPEDDEKPTIDQRMRTAGLLVLEEVGKEHSPSGYAGGRIAEVIVYREAEKRPTIVTTNLSSEEFCRRYGKEHIASRLDGDGVGWVTCTGPDLRQREHWQEAAEKV